MSKRSKKNKLRRRSDKSFYQLTDESTNIFNKLGEGSKNWINKWEPNRNKNNTLMINDEERMKSYIKELFNK